jgi:methionyl-tRNA formyltransferase
MISVVFFGSGPVAARSLELLSQYTSVEAVITKPKPAHHRGEVPVLKTCEKLGLKTFTPTSKQELSELFKNRQFESHVGVVIDYGIIISKDVIDSFDFGIINSHFSLLPEWRGADPITFSILSGQKETGVSLMLIDEKMDEGELLAQSVYELPADITSPELTNDLIDLSDGMLQNVLPAYLEGAVAPRSQDQVAKSLGRSSEPTYSRKLTKQDGQIDWTKPADQIEKEIRAFIEWPKSYAKLGSVDVIIKKAYTAPSNSPDSSPGNITIVEEANIIMVDTAKGSLCIQSIQPQGKKEMPVEAFLKGYKAKLALS